MKQNVRSLAALTGGARLLVVLTWVASGACLAQAGAPADAVGAVSAINFSWLSYAAVAEQWMLGMLLILSVMAALTAHLYRRESQASCLGHMLLAGVACKVLPDVAPLASTWLPAAGLLSLALLLLWGFQFLSRQVGAPQPRIDQLLWLQALLLPAATMLIGPLAWPGWTDFCQTVLVLEFVGLLAWYVQQCWRQHSATLPDDTANPPLLPLLPVTGALGVAGAALLIDQAVAWALPASSASLRQALGLGLPLALVSLSLHFFANFVRGRRAADLQQVQLEQQMGERINAMERDFANSVEQKLEQVTERERKRIAADLHDDLGAKLLTIVHTSESDRISTLAREALEEMRLSVRGLTGRPVQLIDALGDWRAEVISRLGQANILAEWKAPAEEIEHTLPARAYVQTTRIFREAVSNIIKHSACTHCTISCNVHGGDFMVIIQDNGQGIPAELDGRLDRGHGMASMKSRAKQMHGQCLVESGPGWGTVIRLTIPL